MTVNYPPENVLDCEPPFSAPSDGFRAMRASGLGLNEGLRLIGLGLRWVVSFLGPQYSTAPLLKGFQKGF